MSKRNLIVGLIVIVALGVGGFFWFRQTTAQSANTTANLQTVQIERGTLASAINAAGSIAAPQTATLIWQTTGTVGKVNVSVGSIVKPGDIVMELDPGTLDHTVIQAQADLISAQQDLATLRAGATAQQLAQAKLTVVQMEQALTTAQRNLNNVLNPVGQALFDSVAAAQIAYDTAQTDQTLQRVSQDAIQVQTTENTKNTTYSQLQRAQVEYDDCVKISCAERVRRENALNNAKNAYQTALDNFQAAQLQYTTNTNSVDYNTGTAQQALDKAKANLAAAQAGPDPAKVALYQAQLELAQANRDQSQTDLSKLQAPPDPKDVAAAQAKVATAQAIVDSAKLSAPFGGTVVTVNNRVGDSVTGNSTAVVLADLSSLEIQVAVSEVDINHISIGQEASLSVDAAPGQTFKGKVSEISLLGTAQQGVVTFPVTVTVPNPDPALKPGMTAAVAIVTDSHANVLMVANRAIRAAGGQRTVTVLFEGEQITVPITVGLSNETASEIASGSVKEGDTVVLNVTAATTRTGGGGLFGFFGGGGRGGP